jgi:hypothetical protein
LASFKQRIRQLTRRSGGRSMADVVERQKWPRKTEQLDK